MKYILPFIVLSLGGCGTRLGKQPHEKMDNYQIFNRLAEQVVLSTIDSSGISCNDTNVYLKTSDSEDSNGWFIENWYIRSLQQMQCDSISTLPDVGKNKNQNSIQVDFKIINLNVNYISQDTFWKSNPVRREIEVKLWAKFSRLNHNGNILWMGESADSFSDHILRDQIPALQNEQIDFTQAQVPEFNGYTAILEPIFIMGVSGVIIYLFYAFRSK